MTSRRLGIAASALVVLAPQTSFATLEDLESPFLEQLPIVLSVSRMPVMRLDAPGAVTVIDADLIQATGYRSVGRLLRLVPGMQVGQERGNSEWVTYHGLGKEYPNQTQLLIDGQSVHSPGFTTVTHSSALPVSLLDIERIEVLRGSDFAAYGSNGFLGLINIITRHTDQEDRTTLRLSAGTRGVADVIARTSTRFEAGGLRVTLQSMGDDGFRGLDDSLRSNSVNLRTDLRIGDSSELELTAGHSEARRGLGYQGTLFNGSGTRDETTRNSIARLKWRHVVSANEEFNLSVQHGRERVVDEWTATSAPWLPYPALIVPVDANSSSTWTSLEFHHRVSPARNVKALWGGELRRDKLDAPSLFYRLGPQRRSMARVFGNIEWRVSDQLLVNTSALVERFEGMTPRFAPRVFLIMQPSPARSWRLGYSRAYHQPSVFEQRTDSRVLAPNGQILQQRHVPNPDIQAQRIDVVEAGVFGLLSDKGSYDVRLFQERIKGLIRRMPVSVAKPENAYPVIYDVVRDAIGSSRWENESDPVRLTGLEYELRTPQWHGAQFILSHSMVRAQSARKAVRDSVAPYTASLTWLQDWNGWHSSASLIRRGSMDASTGFLPNFDYVVPAFTQLDVSIWRTVRVGPTSADIRLTGLNLLGRHQEVAHNPLQSISAGKQLNRAGPSVYATVHFTF